jgi:hypothetical protein
MRSLGSGSCRNRSGRVGQLIMGAHYSGLTTRDVESIVVVWEAGVNSGIELSWGEWPNGGREGLVGCDTSTVQRVGAEIARGI